MNMNLRKHICAAAAVVIAATSAFPVSVSAAASGWSVNEAGNTVYIRSDGTYATGIIIIEDTAYKFDDNGIYRGLYTGFITSQTHLYFYNNGKMYVGWLNRPSGTYYLNKDGTAAIGMNIIDGIAYYFDEHGRMLPNGPSSAYNPVYSDKNSFTLTADRSEYYTSTYSKMSFTLTGNDLSSDAYVSVAGLRRYRDGKWYICKPDTAIPDYSMTISPDRNKLSFDFCPEKYYDDLSSGTYKLAVNIICGGTRKTVSCQFSVIRPYEITAEKESYVTADTDRIRFYISPTVADARVYSEVRDIYYTEENGKLTLVEPENNTVPVISSYFIKQGGSGIVMLDLTRYSRSKLKTGTYVAEIGDGLICEFKMTRPVSGAAEEVEIKSKSKKKISFTLRNRSDTAYEIKGYGKLWRYEDGKWKLVKLKKDAKLDTSLSLPARYRWTQSMMLTDYYSYSSLKAGSYRMEFPLNDNCNIYIDFKLS
ncbi:MAG: immunoglobulin-like domain-containing protein [Huintestinicola sp.]